MRMGFSLSASPVGALASACTGTPSSLAALSRIGRTAGDAGTQMAPVPMSWPSMVWSFFSQYTSAPAFNRRLINNSFIVTNRLLKAGADVLAVDGLVFLQPVHIGASLQQTVRHDKGIVDLVADQVAGRGDGPADGTGRRR